MSVTPNQALESFIMALPLDSRDTTGKTLDTKAFRDVVRTKHFKILFRNFCDVLCQILKRPGLDDESQNYSLDHMYKLFNYCVFTDTPQKDNDSSVYLIGRSMEIVRMFMRIRLELFESHVRVKSETSDHSYFSFLGFARISYLYSILSLFSCEQRRATDFGKQQILLGQSVAKNATMSLKTCFDAFIKMESTACDSVFNSVEEVDSFISSFADLVRDAMNASLCLVNRGRLDEKEAYMLEVCLLRVSGFTSARFFPVNSAAGDFEDRTASHFHKCFFDMASMLTHNAFGFEGIETVDPGLMFQFCDACFIYLDAVYYTCDGNLSLLGIQPLYNGGVQTSDAAWSKKKIVLDVYAKKLYDVKAGAANSGVSGSQHDGDGGFNADAFLKQMMN